MVESSARPCLASAEVKLEHLDNLAAGLSTSHGAPVRSGTTAPAPNQKAPTDPRLHCLSPSGGLHVVPPPALGQPLREIVGGHAAAHNAGTPSRRGVDWHPLGLPLRVKHEDRASTAPAGIVREPCQKDGSPVDRTQTEELAGMMGVTEGRVQEGGSDAEQAPNPMSRPDPKLEASETRVGWTCSGLEQEMQLQDPLASYHSMCDPCVPARA